MTINIGDVFYADLSPAIGNEAGGIRPVLIKEVYDDVVIIVPYVFDWKTHTEILHPHQIRSIDRRRLKQKMTK